jgi:hypothetical protein
MFSGVGEGVAIRFATLKKTRSNKKYLSLFIVHRRLNIMPTTQQLRNPLVVLFQLDQDEGWVPRDPQNPNNGQRENVLIVWRNHTVDLEKDTLMLDEWFQKNRISTRYIEFDTISVNGSNNLPNLKLDDKNRKVCLIEEECMKRMWEVEG